MYLLPPDEDQGPAEKREVRRLFARAAERGLRNPWRGDSERRDGLRHRMIREVTGGESDRINRLTLDGLRELGRLLALYTPPDVPLTDDGDLDPRFFGSAPSDS